MKYVDSVKYISTQCLKTPVISSIFILPYFIRLKFNSEFDSMLKFYSNQLLWQHHSDQFWFKVPMGWEAGCSLHIMALKLTEDQKRWEWWILKLAPTTTQIILELFFKKTFLLFNSILLTIRKLHGVCFSFLIFDLFDCKKKSLPPYEQSKCNWHLCVIEKFIEKAMDLLRNITFHLLSSLSIYCDNNWFHALTQGNERIQFGWISNKTIEPTSVFVNFQS